MTIHALLSKLILPLCLNLCLSLPLSLPALAAPGQPLNGPMLGALEIREARIWVQSRQPARLRLQYWLSSKPQQSFWTAAIDTSPEQELAHTFLLERLQAGSEYQYRIELNGQLQPGTYRFKTQADWIKRTDPPQLKIALGSCVYLNDPQADPPGQILGGDYGIFEQIQQQQPDLMLWLGDNVYLRPSEYYSAAGISDRYRQLRELPELQNLLHSTAHYAIWDDHDYGDNDSDRSYRLRPQALQIFESYWANPAYGQPELPGVFSRFVWSDVEFFLTDNRYYRAPFRESNNPDKDFFGPAQLQWLKESLSNSTASFKLIVLGNQTLNTRTPSENMYSYAREFQEFLGWLTQSGIKGVVLLSGDRHHSELLKLNRPGSYPLYEWTVSPLTSKAYPPFEQEASIPERVPGSLLSERNFGLIEVQGPTNQRRLILKLHDAQGKLRWSYQLRQQDLQQATP